MPNNFIEKDSFRYDFRRIAPVEDDSPDFGDYFPEGPRYRFKATKASLMENPESGWQFIAFEAKCLKSPDPELVGRTLKQAFTVPSDDDVANAPDDKKLKSLLFPLRKFHSLAIACGMSRLEAEATIKFNKMLGAEFEGTTQDYTPKPRVKDMVKADGTKEKREFKGKTRSQLDQVYRVGATVASNVDAPEAPAQETVVAGKEAEFGGGW